MVHSVPTNFKGLKINTSFGIINKRRVIFSRIKFNKSIYKVVIFANHFQNFLQSQTTRKSRSFLIRFIALTILLDRLWKMGLLN